MKDAPVQEFAELISRGMILSHLLGRDKMNQYIGKKRAEFINMKETINPIFFEDIPTSYEAALKFFLERNIIEKPDYLKLSQTIRKQSFTVARTTSVKFIEDMKRNLTDTIAGINPITGKKIDYPMLNIEDWLDNIDEYFKINGMHRLKEWHLRVIFLENMRQTFNQGETAMMKEADLEEFPLWEFITIEDERTRKSHLKWNGFKAPPNDPIWNKLTPPLDFGCRCRRRPVHVDEKAKASTKRYPLTGTGYTFVN